ncbi:MAG TPA: MmgE/PrpD family protein [Burkholderiales bacterium]|nr:MmgE/PrpD family protein [Burkholderiales bacterium]
MSAPAVTQTLARFLTHARETEFPADAVHEAKRAFLHWIGCAIGGAGNGVIDRSLATFSPFAGPEQATVVGRPERTDALLATFLNAMAADVLGFSDTHLRTVLHPGGVVGPAVTALAERQRVSGNEALRAFLAGVEVACRIGVGVYDWHYGRGWHITGSVGTFGAAAAAGVLLKLDETRMAWALSMAATHATGLRELFGSMGKSLHAARAAQNGLASALLAANDFTSSTTGIEGRRGFAHVLGDKPDLEAMVDGLGTRFEILSNTYKPFPCGVVIHPVIDGCIQLSEQVRGSEVKRVALQVNPLVLELCGRREPKTTAQAKLSVFHSAAAALTKGRVTEVEYSEASIRDPALASLAARCAATPSPSIREDEARITVELADGRAHDCHVEHAVGSEARPMSDADLERKFRGLAEPVLANERIDRLIDGCWNIEKLDDVGALIRQAAPQ